LGANSGATPDQILLRFSTGCVGPGGGLATPSATEPSHYLVSGGIQVNRAELFCEGTAVILTVSPRPTEGVNYTVTVNDVQDWAGNVVPAGSQASFRADAVLRGALRREVFQHLTAGTIGALTNDVRFPYCPDQSEYINGFEAPRNVGER